MAIARTRLLKPVEPEPDQSLDPIDVTVGTDEPDALKMEDGALTVEHSDGTATVDFNPDLSDPEKKNDDFGTNLALKMDTGELDRIASSLLEGIEIDEQSRREWLSTRERGIVLLGLKLEEPRGDVGTSSAPLEGQATVRHPLLLEATIRFQATAGGELLPATGPVKVRNDATAPPVGMGHNQGPPLDEGQPLEELANALEKDMNHYLTATATEYVPDTDRMLFYVGFGGDGFKKVYNCPLRRRPVSESTDAENVIVSNAATDIRNCGRVTHKIRMRPSILRRMQILGAYRDVPLQRPNPPQPNAVEQAKAAIQGTKAEPQRPEDTDYTVFETCCELDLDKFAPKQFKGKGLPLPYKVAVEKDSRQILEIRRNWDEKDEQCLAKQFFVQFPFIRGLGFYGLGLVHILGNATVTLTALWREFVDSGMFANFPGFLYAKSVGRQLSNQMRVPAGGGLAIDVPPGMRLQDAVMAVPYKEPGAGFTAFVQHIEEVGQRLGQTADVPVGEGKQEMPVGTIMALIEQATKVMDSVHKRLHAAQAEEFRLLKERFREDPEAFWRHNKRPTKQWTKDQFVQALESNELVPVSDPNNPTSLHRIAKAVAILQLAQTYQQFFNIKEVLARIFRIVGIDPEGLFNDQPAPPPPDPRMEAIQAKERVEQVKAQIAWVQVQIKQAQAQYDMQDQEAERASRERIEQLKLMESQLRIRQEMIIHAHDMKQQQDQATQELQTGHAKALHEFHVKQTEHEQDLAQGAEKHQHGLVVDRGKAQQQLDADRRKHQQNLESERQRHEQGLRHAEDEHAADLEFKRKQAQIKPKAGGS